MISDARPDTEKFLLAAFALALVGTIEADEKPRSARWNRARQAHDPLIRLCDTYLPDAISHTSLTAIWDIIDGPVMAAIRGNLDIINKSIGEAHGHNLETR